MRECVRVCVWGVLFAKEAIKINKIIDASIQVLTST